MARKAVTCVEASSDDVDTSLFKSWSPRGGWDNSGGGEVVEFLHINIKRTIFRNFLLKTQLAIKAVTCVEASLDSVDSSFIVFIHTSNNSYFNLLYFAYLDIPPSFFFNYELHKLMTQLIFR